jgi:hypothetical protein
MAVDANNIITTVGSAVFGWLGQKEQAKAAQFGAGSRGTYLLLGDGLLLLVTVIALKKS